MKSAEVAFIGVGNMGLPMARMLLQQGYSVRAFDVNDKSLQAAVEYGAEQAESATAAARGADFVITMLPNTEAVIELYFGTTDEDDASDGLLDAVADDAVVIDCSTIAPKGAEQLHEAAAHMGIPLLDAPVSGGTASAARGELTFMVGGDAEVMERASDMFTTMGARHFHAGGPGKGQVAKICNNMLLAICMVGTAETLALGVELGMDPKLLTEIMSSSSGGNWSLTTYNPYPGVLDDVPASNNYEGGFSVALMLKDLGLGLEAAEGVHQDVQMAEVARFLYERLKNTSNSSILKDFSSIQTLYIRDK